MLTKFMSFVILICCLIMSAGFMYVAWFLVTTAKALEAGAFMGFFSVPFSCLGFYCMKHLFK